METCVDEDNWYQFRWQEHFCFTNKHIHTSYGYSVTLTWV